MKMYPFDIHILTVPKVHAMFVELARHQLSVDETWYVVSAKWWAEFRASVDRSEALKINDMLVYTNCIDNSDILRMVNGKYVLKENLKAISDYVLLPAKIFDVLAAAFRINYGHEISCSVIENFSTNPSADNKLMINVYPMSAKFIMFNCFVKSHVLEIGHLERRIDTLKAYVFKAFEVALEERAAIRFTIKLAADSHTELTAENLHEIYETERIVYMNRLVEENVQSFVQPGKDNCVREVKPGLCGLKNYGTNCYLNAALQCLSHVPELREYFLSGKFDKDVEAKALVDTRSFTYAYRRLMTQLWKDGASQLVDPIEMMKLTNALTDRFEINAQHDAHEWGIYLLDAIDEELSRDLTSHFESRNNVADESSEENTHDVCAWNQHRRLHNSVIADLFHGLLKSTLTCAFCAHSSARYESFDSISLPLLLQKSQLNSTITYIDSRTGEWLKFTITHWNNATVEEIIVALKSELDIPLNLKLILLKDSKVMEEFVIFNTANMSVGHCFAYLIPDYYEENDKDTLMVVENQCATTKRTVTAPMLMLINSEKIKDDLKIRQVLSQLLPIISAKSNANDEVSDEKTSDLTRVAYGEPSKFALYVPNMDLMPKTLHFYVDGCVVKRKRCSEKKKSNLVPSKTIYRLIFVWKKYDHLLACDSFMKCRNLKMCTTLKFPHNSVESCLEKFLDYEVLDDDNKWKCSKCKIDRRTFKKFDFVKMPKIFVIQMKRFKQILHRHGAMIGKDNAFVSIPTENFTPFDHTTYDLIAKTCHMGGVNGGHYAAFALNNNHWTRFDDARVAKSLVDLEPRLCSTTAYTLYYRRSDDNVDAFDVLNTAAATKSGDAKECLDNSCASTSQAENVCECSAKCYKQTMDDSRNLKEIPKNSVAAASTPVQDELKEAAIAPENQLSVISATTLADKLDVIHKCVREFCTQFASKQEVEDNFQRHYEFMKVLNGNIIELAQKSACLSEVVLSQKKSIDQLNKKFKKLNIQQMKNEELAQNEMSRPSTAMDNISATPVFSIQAYDKKNDDDNNICANNNDVNDNYNICNNSNSNEDDGFASINSDDDGLNDDVLYDSENDESSAEGTAYGCEASCSGILPTAPLSTSSRYSFVGDPVDFDEYIYENYDNQNTTKDIDNNDDDNNNNHDDGGIIQGDSLFRPVGENKLLLQVSAASMDFF